jgi:hypothetical protein
MKLLNKNLLQLQLRLLMKTTTTFRQCWVHVREGSEQVGTFQIGRLRKKQKTVAITRFSIADDDLVPSFLVTIIWPAAELLAKYLLTKGTWQPASVLELGGLLPWRLAALQIWRGSLRCLVVTDP